jgi:death-on-curing protein
MSEPPSFLTVSQVLQIHRRMVSEFGGASEVRDHGLLEAAVMMPAARYCGRFLHDGLPAMAAACLFHICKSHAFVDGNKRTALASAEVFLMVNGMELLATNAELVRITRAVADGTLSKAEVVAFFRAHATPAV